MCFCTKNQQSGVPTRSDTNKDVQSQNIVRSLEGLILENKKHHTIYGAETKALVSCAVTSKLSASLFSHMRMLFFFRYWQLIHNYSESEFT